ncbi:hypothetical protein EON66_00585 [archaeon]|nr:MAG: hypothetical protein EON66_00585 [archaeon]
MALPTTNPTGRDRRQDGCQQRACRRNHWRWVAVETSCGRGDTHGDSASSFFERKDHALRAGPTVAVIVRTRDADRGGERAALRCAGMHAQRRRRRLRSKF